MRKDFKDGCCDLRSPAPPPQGIPLRSLRSASPFDSRKGTFTLTLALSHRGRGDDMLLRSSQGVQGYSRR